MIQGYNLSKGYGGRMLFENASFTVQPGERCALVGRNGSGKTTLLRLITGEESFDEGSLAMPNGYRIGYLRQHISFTQSNLLDEAALGLPPDESYAIYKAEKILFGLGFTEEDLTRSPGEFSGGYALRIHLAKVLLGEPDALLLDEPTNYLDILSVRWLSRFLRTWQGVLLLISHDRQFVEEVTTHTIGIHRQQIHKVTGTISDYYEQIALSEELHEKNRERIEKKREHLENFIRRFGAKATKAGQAQSRKKELERLPGLEKLMDLDNLNFSFRESTFPGRMMIEADSLRFSYEGQRDLPPGSEMIDGFSLSIEKGERIAIVGKNGYGKSTLLRLIEGELKAKSGTIKRSDNLRVGYFGQTHIDRLDSSHTVEQEIAEANSNLSYGEVRAICGLMMFSGGQAKKKISVLSGGERSRVLLGKIVATPCNLLLLDEPTNHLDMESIEALLEAVERFEGAVVLVTHSELLLHRIPEKLVICHKGEQEVFMGDYGYFLEKVGWEPVEAEKKEKRTQAPPPKSQNLSKIEGQIARIEEEIARLNEEMEAASANHKRVAELHKQVEAKRKEIDKLYEEIS